MDLLTFSKLIFYYIFLSVSKIMVFVLRFLCFRSASRILSSLRLLCLLMWQHHFYRSSESCSQEVLSGYVDIIH